MPDLNTLSVLGGYKILIKGPAGGQICSDFLQKILIDKQIPQYNNSNSVCKFHN